MTDDASEEGSRPARHRHRRRWQRDQGGRRGRRMRMPELGAAQGADADAVDAGGRHRLDRPVGQASGQVAGPRRHDPGRDRPARRDPRWHAQVRRQHRPGLDRLPGRRAADQAPQAPDLHHQRRRRGGDRRDALRCRQGQARQGHLPDAGDRRRLRRVQRRRAPPEHRVRADGDQREAGRAALRRGRARRAAGCRGRRGRWISTSTSSTSRADVAQPHDPRRRGQQERRQVHPAADRELRGRARRAAQRRRDHRRGHRGRRESRSRRPTGAPTATQPARSTREAKT